MEDRREASFYLRCDVAYWHIAAFTAPQQFGRQRSKADIASSLPPRDSVAGSHRDFVLEGDLDGGRCDNLSDLWGRPLGKPLGLGIGGVIAFSVPFSAFEGVLSRLPKRQ